MATQKKGCGFLITALILLIIGGVICGVGIKGAMGSFEALTSFETPHSGKLTPEEDGAISVWLHGSDTTIPSGISINAKDTSTGEFVQAPVTSNNTTMASGADRKILLGAFEAKKGTEYEVYVTGLSSGREISLSNVSVGGLFGSIGLAIVGPIIFGLFALVFGIIGLVKFLGSKNKQPIAAAPGPPAA